MATESRWRPKARDVMQRVRNEHPDLLWSPRELLAFIDKAYPFGQRKYLPYKHWLEERTKFMASISTDPMMRRCTTCGAGLQKVCRPIGNDDVLVASQMVLSDAIKERKRTPAELEALHVLALHASRTAHLMPQGAGHDDLPLFAFASVQP